MTAKGKKGSNRRGPYAPRDPFPPDPRCFQQYLIRAQPGQAAVETKGAKKVEAERVEAIRHLLFLRDNASLPYVKALQLDMFLNDLMIEAAASGNSTIALARLIGEAPKPGRPHENTRSNLMIAADVAYRMRKNKITRDAACEEVAKEACLSKDSVLRIYKHAKQTQRLLHNASVAGKLLHEQGAQGDD